MEALSRRSRVCRAAEIPCLRHNGPQTFRKMSATSRMGLAWWRRRGDDFDCEGGWGDAGGAVSGALRDGESGVGDGVAGDAGLGVGIDGEGAGGGLSGFLRVALRLLAMEVMGGASDCRSYAFSKEMMGCSSATHPTKCFVIFSCICYGFVVLVMYGFFISPYRR